MSNIIITIVPTFEAAITHRLCTTGSCCSIATNVVILAFPSLAAPEVGNEFGVSLGFDVF